MLNEELIRSIVRDEMQKNYMSGSPDVPPHSHNDTDGFKINPMDLIGFNAVITTNNKNLVPETGKYEYGYASPLNIGSTGQLTQSIVNVNNATYPIPYVLGFGVGVFSAFNGGFAENGTLIAFSNAGTTGQLWIRIEGKWKGVALPLTA